MAILNEYPFKVELEYLNIIGYCGVALVGVLGNLTVLLLCIRINVNGGVYLIYYASLALADLCMCGPAIIPTIFALCNGHQVSVAPIFIQFWGIINIMSRISSLYILTLISLERMIAVCKPHTYRRIKIPHAIVGVSICWLLSILVAITPYFFAGKHQYYKGAGFAGPDYNVATNKTFILLTEFLATYAPSFMITLSVLVIGFKVRSLKSQAGIQKVTMTLLFVLTTYVTLFLLYFIFVILVLSDVIKSFNNRTQIYLQNFAFLILSIHHAANPIIYAFRSTQFKNELRNVNTMLENKVNKYVAPLASQGHMFTVSRNSGDNKYSRTNANGDTNLRTINMEYNSKANNKNNNSSINGHSECNGGRPYTEP